MAAPWPLADEAPELPDISGAADKKCGDTQQNMQNPTAVEERADEEAVLDAELEFGLGRPDVLERRRQLGEVRRRWRPVRTERRRSRAPRIRS